jgi:hypothetical protein
MWERKRAVVACGVQLIVPLCGLFEQGVHLFNVVECPEGNDFAVV